MLSKKYIKNYTELLSNIHGIPKKNVHKILMYGMANTCKMIKLGEDVHLEHFGSFYFDKKAYSKYLKKLKND